MGKHERTTALELMDDATDNFEQVVEWHNWIGPAYVVSGVLTGIALAIHGLWSIAPAGGALAVAIGIAWARIMRVKPLVESARAAVSQSIECCDDYEDVDALPYTVSMSSDIVPMLYEVSPEDLSVFEQALMENPETAAKIDAFLKDPSTGIRRERPTGQAVES